MARKIKAAHKDLRPPAPPAAPAPSFLLRPDGPGLYIRLAVVAAVAVLLWWNMTPPKKGQKRSSSKASASAPAQPEKGAPNTMQELTFDFGPVKTVRGSTGWGGVPKKDQAIMGGPLTMNKIVYKTGIGTHAPSEIVLDLKGKFDRFTCLAGVDDKAQDPVSFILVVKAGDRKLFQSKVLKKGSLPVPIDLGVKGVKELSLIVEPDGDPNWDQADWVDLKFIQGPAAAQ